MLINDAATLTELQELYPKYETALVTNDVQTLTAMFWASPHVMRFGVTENLYGIEELARKIVRLDIVTFGTDFGSVTLEFERQTGGKLTRGRQSQTWVRLPEGWRIVAAHVSLLP